MKVNLGKDTPQGYRKLRNRAVWFLSAWTTKAEADVVKKHEIAHKRPATIIEKFVEVKGQKKYKKVYAVYSAN